MPPIQKKVCLLGDFAVGKTSLIRRLVEGKFEDKYLSTIGTKISRKTVQVNNRQLNMLIWDLAGGEQFEKMTHSYYRGAAGAIIVYDVTRPETQESILSYAQSFLDVNPQAVLMLAGNKIDLIEETAVSLEALAALAKYYHASYLLTSAKTGQSVEHLFLMLAEKILGVR